MQTLKALANQYTDTEDKMKDLRQHIRRILEDVKKVEIEIPIDPPPPKHILVAQLNTIKNQMLDPVNPANEQEDLDKNFPDLFADLVKENTGVDDLRPLIVNLTEESLNTISLLKSYFNTPRPQELADEIGFDLNSAQSYMETAQTESYPSGHTTQAYLIAFVLKDIFPQLEPQLLELARKVSESRIDRGVHYPSDAAGGLQLAKHLYRARTHSND